MPIIIIIIKILSYKHCSQKTAENLGERFGSFLVPLSTLQAYAEQGLMPWYFNSSDGRVVRSVCLLSCRLWFDSESGQTNDFNIGIYSFPA